MPRLAAIDIGTNSALLLVADCTPDGQIHPVVDREIITRLGDGLVHTGSLKPDAMQRAQTAIAGYILSARENGAEKIMLTGTSAVREASNRVEFLSEVTATHDIEMQVLSGETEAEWTFWGALSNKPELAADLLMVDIGGGSTEVIYGSNTGIQQAVSLPLGSVRLSDRFKRSDPIQETDLLELQEHIRGLLRGQLAGWPRSPVHLVGIAGTVTTLAAMNLDLDPYDGARVDGHFLSRAALAVLGETLRSRTVAEIAGMPGIAAARAPVIVAGAVILLEIMDCFEMDQVLVSDRGLRYGVLRAFLKDQGHY